MMRRLGFIACLCGMVIAQLTLSTVLGRQEAIACAIGLGLMVLGILAIIQSVARKP